MRTFSHIPNITVKMSVYDYADVLRTYAPPSVCVWYMPNTGELKAGLRDSSDTYVTLPRNGTMCLDDDLNVLFGLINEVKCEK